MKQEFQDAQSRLIGAGWLKQTKNYIIGTDLGPVNVAEIAEGTYNPPDELERVYSIVACTEILRPEKAVEVLTAMSDLGFMPFICIVHLKDGLRLIRSIDVPDYIFNAVARITQLPQGVYKTDPQYLSARPIEDNQRELFTEQGAD